jgi:hypothetical protein
MFYRRRTPPKPKEAAMPIEKKVCAYCGKNRFGLEPIDIQGSRSV